MKDSEPRELLGPDEQEALTAQLERQAQDLRSEIAAYEDSGSLLRTDCEPDAADAGARSSSEGELRTQGQQARLQLGRIEAALERLREGVFGECTRCSRPVGRERLIAMPTAELCLACQTLREKSGRAQG